ncbi:DNA repair protein RadC [Paenibacillus sp. HN-1]|nr:DNA repair protein RadC [Paenibacillus sp. CGMCC 1.18879]MBY9083363.1 DNA repair protein RadC [Paenibacillus sinensis]
MNEFMIKESDVDALPPKKRKLAQHLLEILKKIMQDGEPKVLNNPQAVFENVGDLITLFQEHFVVLFLDTKNRMIKRKTIFVGSLNAAIVHPREVFKAAIENSAASIICVHNHPSGNPTPSQEDILLTKRLVNVGELVGIDVLDHVVVGREGFVSLKERGLM